MSSLLYRPRLRKASFYAIVTVGSLLLLTLASLALWLVAPRAAPLPWVAAALLLAWGMLVERQWPEVTRHDVALWGLPVHMDGFRIVHLSDVHWDAYIRPIWLEGVMERVNRLRPDMVVLTGDLVTHFKEYIEPCVAVLGRLRARRGVFAVLGNHDHWASGRLLTAALERHGVEVLSNRHLAVDGGEEKPAFWLVGVDDPHLLRADLGRALDGIPDDRRPRVLLAHSPDIMEEAEGRVDLVLTGHTHGGQVRLPVLGPLVRATRRAAGRRFTIGMGSAGRTVCFTNRGLGSVLIPIRFNCRPEVAVITLHPAPAHPTADPATGSTP